MLGAVVVLVSAPALSVLLARPSAWSSPAEGNILGRVSRSATIRTPAASTTASTSLFENEITLSMRPGLSSPVRLRRRSPARGHRHDQWRRGTGLHDRSGPSLLAQAPVTASPEGATLSAGGPDQFVSRGRRRTVRRTSASGSATTRTFFAGSAGPTFHCGTAPVLQTAQDYATFRRPSFPHPRLILCHSPIARKKGPISLPTRRLRQIEARRPPPTPISPSLSSLARRGRRADAAGPRACPTPRDRQEGTDVST